jgi:uncharacterized membrane protein YphA (DoxX/SURF4 family)
MNGWRTAVHGISLAGFGYIFGYAGLFKVLGVRGMMEGMAQLGFGMAWTRVIGAAEVLGVLGIAVGLAHPPLKNLSVLLLLPLAVGAFAVHMSHHHGFADYKESLAACVLGVIALGSDRRFRVALGQPVPTGGRSYPGRGTVPR